MSRVVQREPIKAACRASVFGSFQLQRPDGTEIMIANRRARIVLAMLCANAGQPVNREILSKLLWPGRFEAHAKASLRQCLLDLGKLLSPLAADILDISRNTVALHPGLIQSDFGDLEQALAQGEYLKATELLKAAGTQQILEHMDFGDAFNFWLDQCRADAKRRLGTAVKRGLSALRETGEIGAHDELLDAWSARDQDARRAGVPSKLECRTRVAVLPFASDGVKDGPDYFADGMVDELITALGQVPQLLVAGRTSSFHFRGSDQPTPQIAAALGVTHLIEGSVQRQGDQVRVHAHLIDGATGFELSGARNDGTLDAIFQLQEDVAQAVTHALADALGLELAAPLVRKTTDSKAAYDLYLQGRALCARLFGEGLLDKAITLLEEALIIDPAFAECWVMLAEAHQLVATYTQCPDRSAASLRMAECARKAIALSPTLGYPYALLGIHEWAQRNIVGAIDLAFRAYRLEPNNPAVTMRLGSFLIYCGRTSDAAAYVHAAINQDPVDPRKHALVWALNLGLGRLEEARDAGQRMADFGFPSTHLAFGLSALGQHELAVERYQETKHLVNTIILPPVGSGPMTTEAMDAYWLIASKGICSGQESDRQIYSQILEMMYATFHDKGDLAIAIPAIMTGNAELTFKSIGDYPSPANMLALAPLWSDFDPVRQIWQHPEFIRFAQRIGMAAAWDKYGWPDLLGPPSNH